jgi:hypothetical protein
MTIFEVEMLWIWSIERFFFHDRLNPNKLQLLDYIIFATIA